MVPTRLFDLSGKVALLTGASRGMGRAMAMALADHGAKVMVSSRKLEPSQAVADEINRRCGEQRAFAFACNAGYEDQLRALVDATRAQIGPIDVLVGNAGVNPYYGAQLDISDEAYDKTMSTNVKSNLWLARLVAPDMLAKGRGSMMFTASVGAFIPSLTLGTYNISKMALISLVRNLAAELGPKGVRVNAICPGLIRTDFAQALWNNPEAQRRALEDIPLRRLGEAEDLGGLSVFLASDASAYITGQAITIDGGTFMRA